MGLSQVGSLGGMVGLYLTDMAVWHRWQGEDEWGEPNPRAPVPVRVRIDRRQSLVRNQSGEEVLASARVMMKDRPDPRDRIEFDGRGHSMTDEERRALYRRSWRELGRSIPVRKVRL